MPNLRRFTAIPTVVSLALALCLLGNPARADLASLACGAGMPAAGASLGSLSGKILAAAPAETMASTETSVRFDQLNGLTLLTGSEGRPSDTPKEVILIIPGIGEDGSSWASSLPALTARKDRRVYVHPWNQNQKPEEISRQIAQSINQLSQQYAGVAKKITLIAHSAGGVLLLKSMSDPQFAPVLSPKTQYAIHTIASPLAGLGWPFGADLGGPVRGLVGGMVTYKDIQAPGSIQVWYTDKKNDASARGAFKMREPRFPIFEGKQPSVTGVSLPEASHEGAVAVALPQILR